MRNDPSNAAREVVLGLRLSPSERARLDEAARSEGDIATSTWARRTLLGLAALELGNTGEPGQEL